MACLIHAECVATATSVSQSACSATSALQHEEVPFGLIREQFPFGGVITVLRNITRSLDFAVMVLSVDDEEVRVLWHANAIASDFAAVAAVVVRSLVMRESGVNEVG